jgi:hypothetical protein
MHLLFGDSHVLYLEPFLGETFHCESYPGWTTERFLQEFEWTLELALQEETYESCTLLVGVNDSSMPIHETMSNLRALKEKASRLVPLVRIAGYPYCTHDVDVQAPALTEDCFEEDGIHVNEHGARIWAETMVGPLRSSPV